MLPQAINVALGLWLTAAPAVLGFGPPAAHSHHIAGPLAASWACIALWEATRSVRHVNVPLGLWLVAAPGLLDHSLAGAINSVVCGIAIAGCSLLGGTVRQRFGGGWAALWHGNAA